MMPPPNDPEWRSPRGPSTNTSRYVRPRSPTHSDGMPRPNIAVSLTHTKSAARSLARERRSASRWPLPISSSPSTMSFRLIGRRPAVGDEALDRLRVDVDLPLVVDDAATPEAPVALGRLEGRRRPLAQRIDGLHVVVAVHEERGLVRRASATRRTRRGGRPSAILRRAPRPGGAAPRRGDRRCAARRPRAQRRSRWTGSGPTRRARGRSARGSRR